MPFKPNYSQRRSERQRAQQQRHEEKQQRREEMTAQRKAMRGETTPLGNDRDSHKNESAMARKKKLPNSGFVLFDVIYEDGSRSSNRKIDTTELDALNIDASARAIIESQDRKIAETFGRTRGPIKSVTRSAT
jgi:hypothetical protein